MLNLNIYEKGLGLISPPHFVHTFWNISHVAFYQVTKFHSLIAFTSWDIGQYVYYNCLLTRFLQLKIFFKTWHTIMTNCINFRLLSLRDAQFKFLRKRSGTSFSTKFCAYLLKKNVSHVAFYQVTKFHSLIAFTSWDIGQYVYYNCLLTRLWHHKIWN